MIIKVIYSYLYGIYLCYKDVGILIASISSYILLKFEWFKKGFKKNKIDNHRDFVIDKTTNLNSGFTIYYFGQLIFISMIPFVGWGLYMLLYLLALLINLNISLDIYLILIFVIVVAFSLYVLSRTSGFMLFMQKQNKSQTYYKKIILRVVSILILIVSYYTVLLFHDYDGVQTIFIK